MRRPREISGDDIERWADLYGAPGVLPTLVRRLLWATTVVDQLDMPDEGGTRLPGFDGVVMAKSASILCPRGLSVWEMSTRADVGKKLSEDFEERAARPLSFDPRRATYVAVTARRYRGKLTWASERKARGPWADVRCLDADDLANALDAALPVAVWFGATQLQVPAADLLDAETYLKAWSERTSPGLPPAIVLAGRSAVTGALHEFLSSPPRRPLVVRADSREEAVAFSAAAIGEAPEGVREAWQSRALIVRSHDAWRWLAASAPTVDAILLPAFPEPERDPIRARAHVILPVDRTARPSRDTLDLPPLSTRQVASVLEGLGLAAEEAKRTAEESGGKLSALMRRLGDRALPAWAEGVDRDSLFALLFVGQWEPNNSSDRTAVRAFGVTPEELENVCHELAKKPEAPVQREGDVWRWSSPRDAWETLAGSLPEWALDRFQSVVREVLGARDPRFDLPKEERMLAGLWGAALGHSSTLREGLARSLVWLTRGDEALRATYGRSLGSRTADRLVGELLPEDWKAWASVEDVLPWLAEAAPEMFVRCVERSLESREAGVAHLLEEEGAYGGPHTGLLWALETLGWRRELFHRVASALAVLAEHDRKIADEGRGRRLANSPFRSLANMVDPVSPESLTTVEERVMVIQSILEKPATGEIGWRVAVAQLPSGQWIQFPSRRPNIAAWGPIPEKVAVDLATTQKQCLRVLDLLLDHAGSVAERWAGMVDWLEQLPEGLHAKVRQKLGGIDRAVSGPLWNALRKALHYRHAYGEEGPDAKQIDFLMALHGELEPSSLVERFRWRFDFLVEPPEPLEFDSDDYRRRVRELQDDAFQSLWRSQDRWTDLEALARVAEDKGSLAKLLASEPYSKESGAFLLDERPGPRSSALVWMFAGAYFERLGGWDSAEARAWAARTLEALVRSGRVEDAVAISVRWVPHPELWSLLDRLGDPVRTTYWQRVSGVVGQHLSAGDREHAIRRFIEAGRALEAVFTAGDSNAGRALPESAPSPEVALEVLEALRAETSQAGEVGRLVMLQSRLERVFSIADRAVEHGTSAAMLDRMARLEWYFFPLLQRTKRGPRWLFQGLAADPPGMFVDWVSQLYAARGAPKRREPLVGQDLDRWRQIRDLLNAWKSYPGAGLPSVEEREAALERWAIHALDALTAADRAVVGAEEVAKVLARAPNAPDGRWPCLSARRLLESGKYPDLAAALFIARRNLRGVRVRPVGEGGAQERESARRLRGDAEALRLEFPRTAALLDEIARSHEREAEDEDVEDAEFRAASSAPVDKASPEPLAPRLETRPAATSGASAQPVIEPEDRITSIEIEGLRSIDRQELDLEHLTVLIGPNGAGKSTMLEAFELARRASEGGFLTAVNGAHGGPSAMLSDGAGALRLALRVRDERLAAPGLRYEVVLVPGGAPAHFRLREERVLLEGEPEPLLERIEDSVKLYKSAARPSLLDPFGTTLAALGAQPPHPAFDRLRKALSRIELHLPMEVTPLWAARAHQRRADVRSGGPFARADRVDTFASNLANVYQTLTNRADWDDTRELLRLGFDHLDDVGTDASLSGEVILKVRLHGRDILASGLPDGMLSYLAIVAVHQLQKRGDGASLLAFDEPDLHLHPHLLPRVVDLLMAMSRRTPVVIATHSDTLLDCLDEPARSVRTCELDHEGHTRVHRLSSSALAEWLTDYRGLGALRAEGHLPLVMQRRPASGEVA